MSEASSFQSREASHPNVGLINKLYSSIMKGDADAAASCYAPDAHFEDIAFRLDGRKRIHDMWRMVCMRARPTVTFDSVLADDMSGRGHWVARYILRETNRSVVNDIVSQFVVARGFIQSHHDKCSALKWAMQAYPFPKNLVAGLVGPLRRQAAQKKLEEFIRNPGA